MLDPRIYRTGLVAVALAVIVLAFSLGDQQGPQTTTLAPDAFNAGHAYTAMNRIAKQFPSRRPGSPADAAIATQVGTALASDGFSVSQERDRSADGRRASHARKCRRGPTRPHQRGDRRGRPSRRARLAGRSRGVGHRGARGARSRAVGRDPPPLDRARLDERLDRRLGRAGAGQVAAPAAAGRRRRGPGEHGGHRPAPARRRAVGKRSGGRPAGAAKHRRQGARAASPAGDGGAQHRRAVRASRVPVHGDRAGTVRRRGPAGRADVGLR